MRILCQKGQGKHLSIYEGWGRVFDAAGHRFVLWDPAGKPAFDMFDEEYPDLYIRTTPDDVAIAKCIADRRNGSLTSISVDDPQPAADTFLFGRSEPCPSLACDYAYVGCYPQEKRRMLNARVGALTQRGSTKIFGRASWPYENYLGRAEPWTVSALYASAGVCPNVSSSGRTSERVYQILLCGGYCLSNPLTDGVFDADVVRQVDDASEFVATAVDMADSKNHRLRRRIGAGGRRAVLDSHTYWHRCRDILANAGFGRESEMLMETYHASVGL